MACPLLEGIDLSGARGVLVLIAASKSQLQAERRAKNAMNTIRRYAADDAHVIFGAAYDDRPGRPAARDGDRHRPEPVAHARSAAAADGGAAQLAPATQQALRTGTDNLPILNHVLATPQQGGAGQSQQTDYGSLSTPSVWRTNRHQAPRPRSRRCRATAWTTSRSRPSCASRRIDTGGGWALAPRQVASVRCGA